MGKVVKSARGQPVDFDLIKIRQQMASAPKPSTVKAREDFIDQKFKRRLKKLSREVVAPAAAPTANQPTSDDIENVDLELDDIQDQDPLEQDEHDNEDSGSTD